MNGKLRKMKFLDDEEFMGKLKAAIDYYGDRRYITREEIVTVMVHGEYKRGRTRLQPTKEVSRLRWGVTAVLPLIGYTRVNKSDYPSFMKITEGTQ